MRPAPTGGWPGLGEFRARLERMSVADGLWAEFDWIGPVISAIATREGKTPAQVLLAWAIQRGTALLTTPKSAARARENFDISALPKDAFNEINRIQIRQRLNEVVKTGSPGFIPQGR